MAKNIILCADGTGNRGGYTPNSNIYKMYHAIVGLVTVAGYLLFRKLYIISPEPHPLF
ncbi:MAG: DUF2235 domain-containing protein [Gammaproteobacteria bacterium]|nr:DUF2235 domain-containing protein [Gammaproteobacteria bacterium]